MPRKWIDKKNAQHFTLVHRPQNDPLIHDQDAPSMVLHPVAGPSKIKHLDDLASELGADAERIRANEGEAAEYGVYFDDSEYDYMQHLRDLHSGAGEVVFVEAQPAGNARQAKQKQPLHDALRQMDLERKSGEMPDEHVLPSKNLTRATYEAQQAIPDAIAGFQPDMDPRLREVLEALDDDAYVEEDEDIFQNITSDRRELDDYEFGETAPDYDYDYEDEDEEGWESDGTAKPDKEYGTTGAKPDKEYGTRTGAKPDEEYRTRTGAKLDEEYGTRTGETSVDEQPEVGPSQDWLKDFKAFKKEQKAGQLPVAPSQSELQSAWTSTTNGGRKKKRKGALTDASSYSMTSSSLVRTEQMTLLDARFDKIEEAYQEEMDEMGSVSAASAVSSVQGPTRNDFDNILDDFLGSYTKPGKRTSKKTRAQTGLEQLDEIRRGLGPARIRGKT